MTEHIVKQGECLSSLAHAYGLPGPNKIANWPVNAGVMGERSNVNIMLPGDHLEIPEKISRIECCSSEQRHRFRRHMCRTLLKIRLLDQNSEPHDNMRYQLNVDGRMYEGNTDDDGRIEHAVDPVAVRGELKVWLREDNESNHTYIWPLAIGCLDPKGKPSGAQGRLRNLGYEPGPVDGDVDDETESAVCTYQEEEGLSTDGLVNDHLGNALEQTHGV